MKKIISLVLALVMVFAIAASASALTGDIYEPGPTTGGVLPYTNIKLKLVESIPGAAGFGLLSLTEVAAGKAYYTNQAIYFALEFTTPDLDLITIDPSDFDAPGILISSTNVEFWTNTFALYSVATTTIGNVAINADPTDTSNKKIEVTGDNTVTPPAVGSFAPVTTGAVQYILVGGGIVRGTASGAIRADFAGDIDCTKFFGTVTGGNIAALLTAADLEFGTNAHPIYSGKKQIYTVLMDDSADVKYTVTAYTGNAGAETAVGTVVFYTKDSATVAGSTKNVEQITAQMAAASGITDTAAFYVNDTGVDIAGGGSSSLQFYRAVAGEGSGDPTLKVLSPSSTGADLADYNALKSLYQGIMGFFGLQFSRQGILLPIHFAQKFSTFYAVSNEVKVALSTAVATDPDLELPATGDAATAAGFVMIALAIVAACGLAYRKVRG
ncbi:MAG: hypothetical protein GX580_11250 [Candidatus Hydrogenedens sp.]|nr:hypothetical protein [Candidatus Hydrogenedens sp.]